MIARLAGTLLEVSPPSIVMNVGGVGYEVNLPMSVFDQLPSIGGELTVLTELIVREDAHTLYGFQKASERQLFRDLLKVSGVGPRLALGILSGVSAQEFALMVDAGDAPALTRLPGIGKKTAERLIVEMKGRLPSVDDEGSGLAQRGSDAASEARFALTALGYSQSEALKMVRMASEGLSGEATAQHLIKEALKQKMKS